VAVTFDDGTTASYDLVVGADGPNSFLGTLADNVHMFEHGMHEWTVRTQRPPSWPGGRRERWGRQALLSATPLDEALAVSVRFPRRPAREATPRDRVATLLARIDGPITSALGRTISDESAYRLLPDPAGESTWRTGRVVFCGGAAASLGWSAGVETSLAVEDAATLVDSLVETSAIEDALSRYTTDRRGRLLAVRDAVRAERATWVDALLPEVDDPISLDATLRARAIDTDFVTDTSPSRE
jgi:2-polyprenyl-6-methoxyphenol hydroxylase-like FAD-dependent oxidoreductase